MHAKAKARIVYCCEKSKLDNPEFNSVTNTMKVRTRGTVGDVHWKKASELYLQHCLKQNEANLNGMQGQLKEAADFFLDPMMEVIMAALKDVLIVTPLTTTNTYIPHGPIQNQAWTGDKEQVSKRKNAMECRIFGKTEAKLRQRCMVGTVTYTPLSWHKSTTRHTVKRRKKMID